MGSLENPDDISKSILSKGLDAGTAFEILSIDIADVDVGRNIGAELKLTKRKLIRRLHKQRLKNVVQWQLLENKRCVLQ